MSRLPLPFSSILECKGERRGYYYQDNLEPVLIYFLKENKSLSTSVALLLGGVVRTLYPPSSQYKNLL